MTQPYDISHHLTDPLLMGYSAGQLSEAVDLLIATHISMCDECRARVESYDAIGGALFEGDLQPGDSVEMSASSLAATLARIETMPEPSPPIQSDLPDPLASYVRGNLNDVKWRSVGMGVRQSVLETSGAATARLLFIPAGAAMPSHSHGGMELTLVLKGAFSDEDGRFVAGDVEIADQNTHHTPVADISEDCICLAVTDASLKFKSLLPRLVQPFIGI